MVKVVLAGESGVGKTSLVTRFLNNMYTDQRFSTRDGACHDAKVEVDGAVVEMAIWDTAGQEEFRSMVRTYYRGAHACLLCTTLDVLAKLPGWYKTLQEAEERAKIVLVFTKSDMYTDDQVERAWDKLQEMKDKGELNFEEVIVTSAKMNLGVEEAFVTVAKHAITVNIEEEVVGLDLSGVIKGGKKPKPSCCKK